MSKNNLGGLPSSSWLPVLVIILLLVIVISFKSFEQDVTVNPDELPSDLLGLSSATFLNSHSNARPRHTTAFTNYWDSIDHNRAQSREDHYTDISSEWTDISHSVTWSRQNEHTTPLSQYWRPDEPGGHQVDISLDWLRDKHSTLFTLETGVWHKVFWSNDNHNTYDSASWDDEEHVYGQSRDNPPHDVYLTKNWRQEGHYYTASRQGHDLYLTRFWDQERHYYDESRAGHDVYLSQDQRAEAQNSNLNYSQISPVPVSGKNKYNLSDLINQTKVNR